MDIRIPIGLLFSVVGAIISAWGALGGDNAKLPARLGPDMTAINMNLWWGLVLLAFGLLMLGISACCCKKKDAEEKKSCGTGCGCK
jgi:hypothetical protein